MRRRAGTIAVKALLATLLLLTVACTDGGGVTIEHLETDVALAGPIVAVGDRLIGSELRPGGSEASYGLWASDTGRRWEPVQLPGDDVSGELVLHAARRTGNVVAVAGSQPYEHPTIGTPAAPAFAWITEDGDRWRGGKVADHLWGGPPAVQEAGGLVLAGAPLDQTFRVWALEEGNWVEGTIEPPLPVPDGVTVRLETLWRSARGWRATLAEGTGGGNVLWQLLSEDGRTWRSSACEHGCLNVLRAGDLLLADHEVSLDDGQTWKRMRVPGFRDPWFSDLAEDPDGGWLVGNGADWDVGPEAQLLRSDDGFVWEQVRTPTCDPDDRRWPDFEGFVELGGRLLVAWSCGDEARVDRWHLLEVDGLQAEVVATVPGGSRELIVHRGRLLAPRYGADGRLQGFDLVRL